MLYSPDEGYIKKYTLTFGRGKRIKHMKSIKILFTAILLMASTVGFAQANKQTDAEKMAQYQNRVRQTLQLDYSMPDFTTSRIDARIMGDRLAKILNKTLEMSKSQSNLGMLSMIQGQQIDGLDYCTIKEIILDRVVKQGNEIMVSFNTTLDKNILNLQKTKITFCFVDGVSEDVATNDFFASICRYIRE